MTRTRANLALLVLILAVAVASAGCEVVEGIFKAGLWVGIILVLIVLALVMWIVGRLRR